MSENNKLILSNVLLNVIIPLRNIIVQLKWCNKINKDEDDGEN